MNSPKVDRRKFNKPPPPKLRAVDPETVAVIDEVIAKGVTRVWVARQLGVHVRTVAAVVRRTGAYARIPRNTQKKEEAANVQ
jgi:DNA invertase Pin-like site-specific DNA recombinase